MANVSIVECRNCKYKTIWHKFELYNSNICIKCHKATLRARDAFTTEYFPYVKKNFEK
jgi:hypothetical protein